MRRHCCSMICLLLAATPATASLLPAYLVKDVYPGMTGVQYNNGMDSHIAEVDGKALFWGYDSFNGTAGNLWLSDSTDLGTNLVVATSNSNASSPSYFTPANSRLFYVYNDGIHGSQLWTSDGAAGTTLALTTFTGTDSTSFGSLLPVGNSIFFAAADPGGSAARLRRSDGSIVGTTVVNASISVGQDKSLVEARGIVLFGGYDPTLLKTGLIASDGTSAGTALIKEFPSNTVLHMRIPVNDRMLFSATDASNNSVLWVSDGTAAGTAVLVDTDATINSSIGATVRVDDRVFFVGQDQAHGKELWATGPALAAPALVKDIHLGLIDSGIVRLTAMNGLAYFLANDGINGFELWRSDGTDAGTYPVKDINPDGVDFPAPNGNQSMLDQIGRHLVMGANGGLWTSDGSAGGTRFLVPSLDPDYHVLPVNGQAWFPGGARPESLQTVGLEPYAFDALATLGPHWCVKPELSLADNASISTRTRLAQTTTISNLGVVVDIGHTWIGDLVVKLVHEDTGTSVTLLDRPGYPLSGNGCSGKLMDITFEDSARQSAETSCQNLARPAYPRDGRYKPATPLSAFNNESLAGRWRLDVQDAAAADTGKLHEWCLVVNDQIFADGVEGP